MRSPLLLIEQTSRRLGAWAKIGRTLRLSKQLIETHPWPEVIEVLRHEMAHQYVDEVLGVSDQSAHGPAFRKVCADRAIDHRAVGMPTLSLQAESVLRKVGRLLALADSDNEHEARSAMSTAHRLMRKHNIACEAQPKADVYGFRSLGQIRRRMPAHERVLAGILGEHFFVRPILVSAFDVNTTRRGHILEVCGRTENLDIATHVHAFLLETAQRLWLAHKLAQGIVGNKDRRKYLQGLMMGFSDRLRSEAQSAQAAGLVWVGDPDLAQWMGRRHPRTRTSRSRSIQADAAWCAGHTAGKKLVINKPISNKSRGIRGLLGLGS